MSNLHKYIVRDAITFMDLFRTISRKNILIKEDVLLLKTSLNKLKEIHRGYFVTEVAGSAVSLHIFEGAKFLHTDLVFLRKLRIFCRKNGAFTGVRINEETILQNDFTGLILPMCVSLAIQDTAITVRGTSVGNLVVIDNLTRKFDKDKGFMNTEIGRKVQLKIDHYRNTCNN